MLLGSLILLSLIMRNRNIRPAVKEISNWACAVDVVDCRETHNQFICEEDGGCFLRACGVLTRGLWLSFRRQEDKESE